MTQRSGRQISDTFFNAAFLTLSGGFQDAYTYCCRGGVFANAQTGNIVLMSSNFFRGDWPGVLRYLVPLCAYFAGTYIAELIHLKCRESRLLHWRQLVLILEIAVLAAVAFIPHSMDTPANALVSLACAMQVQSFRKVNGSSYASTMCIGNLRSGTEALCSYIHTKNNSRLRQALRYFGIIALFALGAGFGSLMTDLMGEKAIFISCFLLAVSFFVMFFHKERDEAQS